MSKKNWKFKKGDTVKVVSDSHNHGCKDDLIMEVAEKDESYGNINAYRMKGFEITRFAECDLELIIKNK